MSGIRATIRFLATITFFLPNLVQAANDAMPGAPAAPLQVSIGQTLQPGEENQLVEAKGTVTFVSREGDAVYLELGSDAGSMPVNVAHGPAYLVDLLLKSRIEVRGLCTAVRSVDGRTVASLSTAGLDDLTVLQLPEETWRHSPLCAIRAAMQTNVPDQPLSLRGRVESVQPGRSFLLADGSGRMTVETREAQQEMLGTEVEVIGGWGPRGSNRVFQSVFFRPIATATNQSSLPILTTTEEIRWLKPEEAGRHYPVRVRGVITFLRTGGGNIQDATGGVFIWELWEAATNSSLKSGDYCELEGVTAPGDFSPIIACRKLTILGSGQFPRPIQPSWPQLIGGGLDAQWVEVEGVVLSETKHNLELGMSGGRISCWCPNLEDYLGTIVRVRGVVRAFNDKHRHINGVQINVPYQKFIAVEAPAPNDPFSTPAVLPKELFSYNPNVSAFRRVKVAGQVCHVRNGVCYVMDGTNGIRLIPQAGITSAIGDTIEAVGFPEIQFPYDSPLLTLREALIRTTGHRPLPAPQKIAAADLLNRGRDSSLVQTEARLLNTSTYATEQLLELQTGTRVYFARLDLASGHIPPLPPGSSLQVTGVYVFNSDQSNGRQDVGPFDLLLNSPADIRVLALPSWWTEQHAIMVVSSMAMVILLAVAWISLLHQQVARRTLELSAANQSLKGEIAERKRMENELVRTRLQHIVEQERTRIARDLHDDLGSHLTRIVLLLDELVLQNSVPPSDAPEHPLQISAAAKEVIQSLDETVWAVNPRNDTLPHVFNYLSHSAIEFLKVANVRCRLDFPAHPPSRTISAETRHNLFLAVKEALNNAVRHARATEVRLRATINAESLIFTVEDDGQGFNGGSDDPSADGLQNMRQRMEGIGGQFSLESAPNNGTKVTLTCPWTPRE
jgi:signal transduction histidine kinase